MSRSCVVRLTFLEQCLGTLPSNEQIYRDYIATKNWNRTQKIVEEEVAALAPEEPGRPVTTFARVPDKKGNLQPAIKAPPAPSRSCRQDPPASRCRNPP